jgi:hypothetical protein
MRENLKLDPLSGVSTFPFSKWGIIKSIYTKIQGEGEGEGKGFLLFSVSFL